MKSSLKKLKDCRVRLVVEVEPERVESRFQEVLRDFQKGARLPGFREGRAPLEMVEKRYSKEAHEEVLKSLIPEAYHQSLVAQKVSAVTMPAILDIKMERGKGLSFAAEFEKEPEFSIRNYKGIKLRRESADVTAEDVEKGMASLLDARAEIVPIVESRAVRHGDFIVSDIEIWQDGVYVPGKKGVLLFVEPGQADDFFEKVVGAQIDEVREILSDPSEAEKSQGIVGRKPHYKIWVRGIKEKKLPELDEELAKSFGKSSVEELREAVRKDLSHYKHSESIGKMKAELFDKLLGMTDFSVPQELVEKQAERLLEQSRREAARMGIPESRFEEDKAKIEPEARKKAQSQVKLYFILRKIAQIESIDIDEAQLEQRLQNLAQESKRTLDEVRHIFEDDLRESMMEASTVDFLIANAKFEENKP